MKKLIPGNMGLWLLVVFFLHLIFKGFDQSFDGVFDTDSRSLLFSLYLVAAGILVWILGDRFNRFLNPWLNSFGRKKQYFWLYCLLHALVAFLLALGINHGYRLGDIYLYGNSAIWEDISFVNPELSLSITIMYLIILGFDGFYSFRVQWKESQIRSAELKSENTLAQYLALKAQIEPHFLFNSLSVLSSLIYESQYLASEFLIRLSRALRYIIEKEKFVLVRVRDEINFLKDYFFLAETRFPDALELDISVSDSFLNQKFVPPACLHA